MKYSLKNIMLLLAAGAIGGHLSVGLFRNVVFSVPMLQGFEGEEARYRVFPDTKSNPVLVTSYSVTSGVPFLFPKTTSVTVMYNASTGERCQLEEEKSALLIFPISNVSSSCAQTRVAGVSYGSPAAR